MKEIFYSTLHILGGGNKFCQSSTAERVSFLLLTCASEFGNLLGKCKKSTLTSSFEMSESLSVISLSSGCKTVNKILESATVLLVDDLPSFSSAVNTSFRVTLQRITHSEKLKKQHQSRTKS